MASTALLLSSSVKAQEKSPPITTNKNSIFRLKNLKQSKSLYGGTLVWGTVNSPAIFNPILIQHSVSKSLMGLIFDSLVRIDAEGKIKPDLAESWDVSEDGLKYTFYLKKGIRFHDGVELSADDVKFTYEMIQDSQNESPWRTSFEVVKKWKVVDKYTIHMELNEPFNQILYKLIREIVPRHLLKGQDLQKTPFNDHPIGTGPFKFKDWDKEINQIRLEANLDYFEGRPYLNMILVKTYSDNSGLWAALMRREVDFVKYLNYADYKIVEDDPSFKAYKYLWDVYLAVVYNIEDPIFRDENIRKAVAYSINKRKIMQVMGVDGVEAVGPFHPESTGFNPDVKPLEYNPVRAMAVLESQGWKDKDKDGVLEKGKKELELRLLVDQSNDFYKKAALVIRQQLSEVGFRVRLLLYEDERELTKEYLSKRKPQAWLRFYKGLGNDPEDAIGSWYSLSTQFGQLWRYKNYKVDKLFSRGRSAKNDKKRAQIYNRIHQIVYDDQPACFLFFPMSFHAVSAKFKNTDKLFNVQMPDYTIKDWYIESNY